MSTEHNQKPNDWRRLHILALKAKTASTFETLGLSLGELCTLKSECPSCYSDGTIGSIFFMAINDAIDEARAKLKAWQKDPPPIAPQETQIGPGNPFPPPPPPPTVAGEEFISLEFLLHLVKEAKRGSGDCFALWLPRLCEELNRWASANAKTPKVEQGKWTGALVFERIAPRGLTNPVGYRAATPEEQAELDRMARAINRNTPLFEPRAETTVISGEAFYKALQKAHGGSFGVGAPSCAWEMLGHKSQDLYERAAKIAANTAWSKTEPVPAGHADKPTPQAPGSLDELRKTIICAITNEKEAVNGQYGGADVGLLLNALVRMVDKAFADHAAQNSKAIERAAEPVKTPEPWTGESLWNKLRLSSGKDYHQWDTLPPYTHEVFDDLAVALNGQTSERV